jgi:predicted alpha/beta superfamily hydrolase/dienelactone hydrolase
MNNSQIPRKLQFPNSKQATSGGQLGLGIWDFFGAWSLGIGNSGAGFNVLTVLLFIFLRSAAHAQTEVSFAASDGWILRSHSYGESTPSVVFVHGGRFTKESWESQARLFTNAGFRVLAIDLRGFGASTNGPAALRADFGSPLDVLAAVRYLRKSGATNVSVIGGSMGGANAGEAAALAEPGEIDALVFLGSEGGGQPERMKGRKLFISTRDDIRGDGQPRLPAMRGNYEKTPEPKEAIILDGSAHAQFIFGTEHRDRVVGEILRFVAKARALERTIHSAVLKEDRNAIIHLPLSYTKDLTKRYPVIYVLDGTSQDSPAAAVLAALAASGEAAETIVVGVPNTRGNRSRDQTPPFMRQEPDLAESKPGAGGEFLKFIKHELIPFVEKEYRTSPHRAICGNSRGGLLVLYSLLEEPELFQARFSFSTPFHREDMLMVDRTREWLKKSGSHKSLLYLSVGSEETERMKAGCDSMKRLLEQQTNNLAWNLDYTANANHSNNAALSYPGALKKWAAFLK